MPDMQEIARELAAVTKVTCPLCHAPAGRHCANHSNTIVWPPHLCRMDAYTHRLDPSEDWPMAVYAPPENLEYVENHQPNKPLLWKTMVAMQLLKPLPDIHEE